MALEDWDVVERPDIECEGGGADLPVEEIGLDDFSIDADPELFGHLTGERHAERVIAGAERSAGALGILRRCFLDVIGRKEDDTHAKRAETWNILHDPGK